MRDEDLGMCLLWYSIQPLGWARMHSVPDYHFPRITVYIRWGYQVLNNDAWAFSGWNIDDVILRGFQ